MDKMRELRLPALEIRQGETKRLYNFGVDGKLIPQFATVSRIKRDQRMELAGYQRPEVLSHITEIKAYLESNQPMIPNSLVIAFDGRVRFEPSASSDQFVDYAKPGTLVIPIDPSIPSEDKPGWIVDGQQRVAAIRDAQISRFGTCQQL